MKPSDHLFQLIHSLTSAEKRFFRVNAQRKGSPGANLYLRLFDILLNLKEYKEDEVKAHFLGEPCLRQFTRTKNYLYESVLQSLKDFHADRHVELRIRNDLDKVKVLFDRSLFNQALTRLSRCKKLAVEYDLTTFLPNILHWERQLLKKTRPKGLVEKLSKLEIEEIEHIKTLGKEIEAYATHDRLFLQIHQRVDAIDNPTTITISTVSPTTFNGRLAFLLSKALFHRHQGDRVQAHQYYQQIIQHWEKAPHQRKAFPDRYEKALLAFLYSAHSIGDYSSFAQLQEFVRQSQHLSKPFKSSFLCISYNLRLLYLMNTQQFEKALSLAADLDTELNKTKETAQAWLPAATNLSVLYFLSRDYANARKWCNRLLDLPRNNNRRDLKELIRTIHLVLLYELKEFELIPYFLKSLQRYIRAQRKLNPMELALGRFLSEVLRTVDKIAHQNAIAKLYDSLNAPEMVDGMIGLEELRMWVKGKIQVN